MEIKTSWRTSDYEVGIYPDSLSFKGFGRCAAYSGDTLSTEEFMLRDVQERVRKLFSAKILKDINRAVGKREKRRWMNGAYMIEFHRAEICFSTRDRFGGTGTCTSLEAFLDGEFHSYILQYFDRAALEEIINAACAMLGRKAPVRASMPVGPPVPRNTDGIRKLISWSWGANGEYNCSMCAYDDVLAWNLRMEDQYGGREEELLQTYEEFARDGIPDDLGHASSIGGDERRELMEFMESRLKKA